jgi:AcrR family transcriptional regulator
MEQDLIDSTVIPGVLPARQARSRQVVANLLTAALKLLGDRDFASLSLTDVCTEAGVTAGAFYKRFDSKELFIEFLQRLVVAEVRRDMAASVQRSGLDKLDLRSFLRRSVAATARWYQRYEGFTRASLRYAQLHPESWSPMRETGARYSKAIEPIVLAIVGHPGDRGVRDAVRFGVQVVLSTFNSMVLIDPGPYRLRDRKTVVMLADAMALLIEEAAANAAAPKRLLARPRPS